MAGEIFDYFAFISYSHEDKETAQKLQKRLERYHMSAKLLQAHPELPKKLSPIFRDESDYFINDLRREDKIIPLIAGGIPRSKDEAVECFPPAILAFNREREPLRIDLKTFGRDGAFLRVIAAMLRLNFTYFKSREDEERNKERKRRLKISALTGSILGVIISVFMLLNINFISQAIYIVHYRN